MKTTTVALPARAYLIWPFAPFGWWRQLTAGNFFAWVAARLTVLGGFDPTDF